MPDLPDAMMVFQHRQPPKEQDSHYWEDRAEEARVIASGMNGKAARELMLSLAEDYEKLAARARRRAGTAIRSSASDPGQGRTPS